MSLKSIILTQKQKLNALFAMDKEAQELIGRAVSEMLRNHMMKLNQQRHRGLYAKGFYAQAADSIHYEIKQVSATKAIINFAINKIGIAQRYYGGIIKPKKAKLLTIPNWKEIAATATHSAPEFKNLFFIKFKSGAMALADKGDSTYKGKKVKGGKKKQQLRIFYWLVKKVSQKPDPSVLPKDADIQDVAYKAVLRRAKELGL